MTSRNPKPASRFILLRARRLKELAAYKPHYVTITKLTNVLQQHRDSKLDSILQGAHVVIVCEFDDAQTIIPLHILDPFVGLQVATIRAYLISKRTRITYGHCKFILTVQTCCKPRLLTFCSTRIGIQLMSSLTYTACHVYGQQHQVNCMSLKSILHPPMPWMTCTCGCHYDIRSKWHCLCGRCLLAHVTVSTRAAT